MESKQDIVLFFFFNKADYRTTWYISYGLICILKMYSIYLYAYRQFLEGHTRNCSLLGREIGELIEENFTFSFCILCMA